MTFVPDAVSDRDLHVAFFGGSTMATLPPEGPAWQLGGLLDVATEGHVVLTNAGAAGFGSNRIRSLMDEVLGHSPDVVVLYTGHNEFMEARHSSQTLDVRRGGLRQLRGALEGTGTWQLLQGMLGGPPDHHKGPGSPTGPLDPGEEPLLLARFRDNLEHMGRAAKASGAAVLWILPASNLSSPPGLAAAARTRAARAGTGGRAGGAGSLCGLGPRRGRGVVLDGAGRAGARGPRDCAVCAAPGPGPGPGCGAGQDRAPTDPGRGGGQLGHPDGGRGGGPAGPHRRALPQGRAHLRRHALDGGGLPDRGRDCLRCPTARCSRASASSVFRGKPARPWARAHPRRAVCAPRARGAHRWAAGAPSGWTTLSVQGPA